MNVNVTVENLAPCKILMRVEVDAQTVDHAFSAIAAEVQRQAKLPGFRPGKTPRELILNTFSHQINDQAKDKLVKDSFAEAVREHKLHIVGKPEIEEDQFGPGQAFQYTVTCETAPAFQMPEYKGLPARIPNRVVTQGDFDRALTVLREKRGTYHDVDRPAATGDFVVVNYTGACEGKPILELAPTAKGLNEHKNYWLQLEPGTFLPGFTEQLAGVKPGEQRTVTVDFPANFVEAPLAGKKGVYQVQVLQVKERRLPELNDEFAKAYEAENMDKLREGVRKDLQNELNYKQNSSIRHQIMRALLERVTCELPESLVQAETRSVVFDIVEQNQKRGLGKEALQNQKDEIYSYATASAKERIKGAFLIGRIADQENIRATQEEVTQRVLQLAQQHQIKPEKLAKQLQERNGLAQIEEQIIHAKVRDFLQLHAKVEEDPTASFDPS